MNLFTTPFRSVKALPLGVAILASGLVAQADIGILSPAKAKKLIENPNAKARPVVFDTRGGYKDHFRGHIPTAHHLEFDTLRGTDNGVPVQYLPEDLTKQLLVRAGVDKDRMHLIYAMGEALPNDEIWLRKGHIPGAVSFHWARLMEKDNTHKFKPFAQVKADLEAAGITPDKQIFCYCGTSREGSLLRFYLKHVAGYPNVRLYEGAWKEYVWVQGKSLPAELAESKAN